MSQPGLILAVVMGGSLALFVAAAPVEVREGRGKRLLWSQPFLLAFAYTLTGPDGGVFGGYFTPFAVVGALLPLVYLWRPTFLHYVTAGMEAVTQGVNSGGGGFRVDLRHARGLVEDGALEEAIRAVREELRKDPEHFEGRFLLAAIFQELKRPDEGLAEMAVLARSRSLTDAQRERVEAARRELIEQGGRCG